MIDGDGVVSVLHLLFCVAASEYMDGPGNLWAAKGKLHPEGLPSLVKISTLYFACNTAFQEKSRGWFEANVITLSSGHLCDLTTSTEKVAKEEDANSRIIRS